LDPQTGQVTPLFNPRLQQWIEHFRREPKAPCGQTTDSGPPTAS
jgi:hypothetical protein